MLDGDGLTLAALTLDGEPLAPERYVATPDRLTIAQPPQRPFRLEIETLVDPSANTQLMGLYRSSGTYCTQCEAEGFRRITYFPDRPDVMAVYTTRIEADKAEAPVLLANGNLVESGDAAGTAGTSRSGTIRSRSRPICSRWSAARSPSSRTRFRTMSGRDVTLRIYVEPGKEDRCGYAMDSLKRSMRWDEEAFGREYDLDIFMIVAVSDFNMGAMENKGLNVFNDKYVLASPETATDADYAAIEAIIAHEYFHNWTGNRITCRDWFQLCLKEGLTVFRDQEFTSDQRSRPVERISDVRGLRAHQFVEDAGPLAHPVRPDALSRDQQLLHGDGLREGRRGRAHAQDAARRRRTSARAWTSISRATTARPRPSSSSCTASPMPRGVDLTQFMLWYSQAGTPEVVVTGTLRRARQDLPARHRADACRRRPGQPAKEPMVIPLVARPRRAGRPRPAAAACRTAAPSSAACSTLTQAGRDASCSPASPSAPVPSLNRGFSAPVKLIANYRRRGSALPRGARQRSVQPLAGGADARDAAPGRQRRRDPRAATRRVEDRGLIAALAAILADRALEPAFVAQVLDAAVRSRHRPRDRHATSIPTRSSRARQALRRRIGAALARRAAETYERLHDREPYSPGRRSAGRRALQNVCLDLLAAGGEPAAIARADAQYRDRRQHDRPHGGARRRCRCTTCRERAAALDDFYARYADDPLIVDKWFSLQAAIPEPATLDARARR